MSLEKNSSGIGPPLPFLPTQCSNVHTAFQAPTQYAKPEHTSEDVEIHGRCTISFFNHLLHRLDTLPEVRYVSEVEWTFMLQRSDKPHVVPPDRRHIRLMGEIALGVTEVAEPLREVIAKIFLHRGGPIQVLFSGLEKK